jgi:hypothetical protein
VVDPHETVLNAFRQTTDTLAGSQERLQEFEVQRERVVPLREFARSSQLCFDEGWRAISLHSQQVPLRAQGCCSAGRKAAPWPMRTRPRR